MAVLPIRTFGDPVLREKCEEVGEINSGLERLVQDMIDTLPIPGGAGLSANQVGVVKRVFIFERDEEIEACINPRMIFMSEDTLEEIEGCLSLPGVGVPVSRHMSIEMEYTDIRGKKCRVQEEDWIARIFQHELDHLDGKLILDRTDRESRVEALQILQGFRAPERSPQSDRRLL